MAIDKELVKKLEKQVAEEAKQSLLRIQKHNKEVEEHENTIYCN